jgi:hypothetical protein
MVKRAQRSAVERGRELGVAVGDFPPFMVGMFGSAPRSTSSFITTMSLA